MYIPQICLYGAFLFVFSHHDHTVLVNKKSNAMLVFILFSTEENLVSFLCCCFAKALPSHFKEPL